MIFIYTHFGVPILQSPGEPERAGEARRADSASTKNACSRISALRLRPLYLCFILRAILFNDTYTF